MIQTLYAFPPGLAEITLDITAEFRGDDHAATMSLIWRLACEEDQRLDRYQVVTQGKFEQTTNVKTAQTFGRQLAGEVHRALGAKLELSSSFRGVGRLRRLFDG